MDIIAIADARRFSLAHVERRPLVEGPDLHVELVCFEAGQRDEVAVRSQSWLYQVLEGEALVRQDDQMLRLGKGRLLSVPADTAHVLENAGGGLLVVLATRAA